MNKIKINLKLCSKGMAGLVVLGLMKVVRFQTQLSSLSYLNEISLIIIRDKKMEESGNYGRPQENLEIHLYINIYIGMRVVFTLLY